MRIIRLLKWPFRTYEDHPKMIFARAYWNRDNWFQDKYEPQTPKSPDKPRDRRVIPKS